MLARLLTTGILITVLITFMPNTYARNLTDQQRYNDGYSNGAQAATTDSTYNPTCDPTGAYTSGGGHTPTYCKGWADGYAAKWNTDHPSNVTSTQTQPLLQPSNAAVPIVTPGPGAVCAKAMINGSIGSFCGQPKHILLLCGDGSVPNATGFCGTQTQNQSQGFVGTDFGDLSDLSNIPLIGGFIASKSNTTGILHNEYGIFVPWSKICAAGQQYLQQDCSQLVDQSTGALTSDGDKAVNCIRNGALIGALAEKHGISAPTVLGLAAPIFGCGGIANLNEMQNSPYIQSLLGIIEPMLP